MCGSSVTVLVMSRLQDSERRSEIRKTWSAGHNNVRFVVGRPCALTVNFECSRAAVGDAYDVVIASVMRENAEHHDILFGSSAESYRGLPEKLKDAYATSLNESSATTWFCKIDDDSFVRLSLLERFLEKFEMNPPRHVMPAVVGHIARGWGVHRSGKWAEHNYKHSMYPPFPVGSFGHCVTRPVAEYIVGHRGKLFNYQGEDVSVGIWLHESPVSVRWVHTGKFLNNGRCGSSDVVISGHNVDVPQMQRCQERNYKFFYKG